MSSNIPINNHPDLTAPTPQNTPLTHAPIAAGLSRPTVPDITEDPAAEALSDNDAEDIQAAFQSGAMQSALAGIVQDRLSSLIGKSSGYIEALPVEVKRTVAALHGVQVKQNELQNQFKREFWELERKGTWTPTTEEIEAGEALAQKDDSAYTPLPKSDGPTPSTAPIPEFWLTALRNHIGISELITERDAGALKHLTTSG